MPPVLTRQSTNREGEDLATPLDVTDLKSLQAATITLYQFNESPPCWKVRSLLHYYNIPYTSVTAYPGSKVEGLDNAYHKIPKLTIGEQQVNDSAVVYRTLAPIVSGQPLTAREVELENRNNIRGLLGALEKEMASTYGGIANAVRYGTSGFSAFNPIKYIAPTVAGILFPLPAMFIFRSMPHGKDGSSLEHGIVYREALGSAKFFHGDELGPLDLSLYGTFACFNMLGSPQAAAVLDQGDGGLRAWYERVDQKVRAIRALDA